jgi:CRISPR-associated protein (TIGR02710 family)
MSSPGPEQINGILFTVGTTIDPIWHTLKQIRPRAVAFVCSEDTVVQVGHLKELLREAGMAPTTKTLSASDPNDLVLCVQFCQQGLAWLQQEEKLPVEQIRVDYTGGTKNLSASAVLAATPLGVTFLYVSGERDRNAGGRVKSGTERLVLNANPWAELGSEELRSALAIADAGQFAAARQIIARLKARVEKTPMTQRLVMLDRVLDGLVAWDAFEPKKTFTLWNDGKLLSDLKIAAEQTHDTLSLQAATAAQKLLEPLKWVNAAWDGWNDDKRPDPVLLDLLANADRRLEQGQTDLAVQLYYRVMELNGDRRLKRSPHNLNNSAVPLDRVPVPLRTQWQNLATGDGILRLGFLDTYELLARLNDRDGKHLWEKKDDWRKHASMRNQSWLVHDLGHLDANAARKFRAVVLGFLAIKENNLPVWPKLSLGR